MTDFSTAVVSPSGIAALIFLALGIAALFGLAGKRARGAVAAAGMVGFVVLIAVAFITGDPDMAEPTQTAMSPDAPAALEPAAPEPPVRSPRNEADRARALGLVAQAEQENNVGRTEEARQAYAEAEAIFEDQEDFDGMAQVALGLGNLEGSLGQSGAAHDAFARAREFSQRSGNQGAEAIVLVALGDLEKTTLQFEAARDSYREARAVFAMAPGADGGGHVVLELDSLAAMPDGEAAARRALEEARLLYQQIEDPAGIALVALTTGDLERRLGNNPMAYTQYRDAIVLVMMGEDRRQLADAWFRLGDLELDRGFHNIAGEALGKALALYQTLGATDGEGPAQLRIGHLQRLLGDYSQSALRYAAAAKAYGNLRNPAGQAAALMGQGAAARLGGRWIEASDYYSLAIAILERSGDSSGAADAWMGLSRTSIGARTLDPMTKALALYQAAGDTIGQGLAELRLGAYETSFGTPDAARTLLNSARNGFQQSGAILGEARALAELARLELKEGNAAAAQAARAEAVLLLARLEDPLLAANQLLGQGDFGPLRVHPVDMGDFLDYEVGDAIPDEPAEPELEVDLDAEALASYPNANSEGLAFLAELEKLLTAP